MSHISFSLQPTHNTHNDDNWSFAYYKKKKRYKIAEIITNV